MESLESEKLYHITVRLDRGTYEALEVMKEILGVRNRSAIIRLGIWFLLLTHDPDLTLRKALKEEAIETLLRGGDVMFADALKPMQELFKELGYT